MNPKSRWILWIFLLAAVAALVTTDQGGGPEPGIVEATGGSARPSNPGQVPASRDHADEPQEVLAIRPRGQNPNLADAFPPRDWRPPPPPPAQPPPPPPPTAPPLPYAVLGKKLEDGQWQVFLQRDDRILIVKPSDTIDNSYRVEAIKPPVMILTYLPLQQEQQLPIGGAE